MTVATRTIGGATFRCSQRTYDHLRSTRWRLRLRYPLARLVVIQGCYSNGPLSAGTHSEDCVLDVRITGIPGRTTERRWLKAQAFLRSHGWAAWWRHTGTWAPMGNWHIHMASIPPGLPSHPTAQQVGVAYLKLGTKVGKYIDGGYTTSSPHKVTTSSQVVDYYNHAQGLAGQHNAGADATWFPADINQYVFRQK